MRRGTRVGEAYVAIAADGDGINEGIVKSVDEAGPGVERAGDEHGQRYGDHFSSGFFDRIRKRFGKRLNAELGSQMEQDGKKIGDDLGSALVQRLRTRLSEADDFVVKMAERLDAALDKRTSQTKLDTM